MQIYGIPGTFLEEVGSAFVAEEISLETIVNYIVDFLCWSLGQYFELISCIMTLKLWQGRKKLSHEGGPSLKQQAAWKKATTLNMESDIVVQSTGA